MDDIAAVAGAVAAVITAVIVLVSAPLALLQYRANSRSQRARWLTELATRFYEEASHKEIRGLVEANERDEFLKSLEHHLDLEQKWTDYLNFFELVAYLHRIGEIQKDDVNAMFEYWMEPLVDFANYLAEFGYENLVQWLDRRQQ